nr:MAG TPA: hypothetical protein [Caudoviricetes sp.]
MKQKVQLSCHNILMGMLIICSLIQILVFMTKIAF